MSHPLRATLLAFGVATLPAMAGGEVGVVLDKQFGKAQTVTTGVGVINGHYDDVSPTGYGFRAGFNVLDLKIASFGLTATYHARAEDDLMVGGAKLGRCGTEYMAIGAQVDWKLLLDLHAAFDLRRERFSTTDTLGFNGSVTSTRPWVSAGLGFHLPTPVLKPFVRFEVAVPVSSEESNNSPDDLRKALAPRYQLALYGGIRF